MPDAAIPAAAEGELRGSIQIDLSAISRDETKNAHLGNDHVFYTDAAVSKSKGAAAVVHYDRGRPGLCSEVGSEFSDGGFPSGDSANELSDDARASSGNGDHELLVDEPEVRSDLPSGIRAVEKFAVLCDRWCDSYSGEQDALIGALDYASSVVSPGEKCLFLTDSLSNLSRCKAVGVKSESENRVLKGMVRLAERGVELQFRFVRGHAGRTGNEEADTVAGDYLADLGRTFQPDSWPPHLWRTCLKLTAKSTSRSQLCDRGFSRSTAQHLMVTSGGSVNPVFKQGKQHPRKTQQVYNQLRLNNYDVPHPQCEFCGVKKDARHVLLECCLYESARGEMWKTAQEELDLKYEEEKLRVARENRRGKSRIRKAFREKLVQGAKVMQRHPRACLNFLQQIDIWKPPRWQ